METPSHSHAFFNPFAEVNLQEDEDGWMASRPPVPPTHQRNGVKPQPLRITRGSSGPLPLPIQGQGTVVVEATDASQLVIALSNETNEEYCFYFVVSETECYFSFGTDVETATKIEGDFLKRNRNVQDCDVIKHASYLRPGVRDLYWLSLDRKNGVVRYGKKYTNAGLALYEATLKTLNGEEWINKQHAFLDGVNRVQVLQTGGNQDALQVVVQPLPIVADLPPLVTSENSITLDDLAGGLCTVPENLPVECQKLYHNVAGPKITLDTKKFPDFSAAIERSVTTPGLIGHTLLMRKATAFGRDNFNGTYLRITIGRDQGDSPGPPYVLEIWPAKHYSPIHDHGNSFAVIKVLHGKINAYFYDSLELSPRVLGAPIRLKKGDITWMSDTNYQVHQLHNEYDTVCCTLQCYQYGKADKTHDEFFEYLADIDGDKIMDEKKPFRPDSDYEFLQFRDDIMEEWRQRDQNST